MAAMAALQAGGKDRALSRRLRPTTTQSHTFMPVTNDFLGRYKGVATCDGVLLAPAVQTLVHVNRASISIADHAAMEWYSFVIVVLLVAVGAIVSIAFWLER